MLKVLAGHSQNKRTVKESTLETLGPLLSFLRSYDGLNEVRGATFHLNGRDFIHFHDDPDGLWADVRLSKGRIRMPVSTRSEQGEVMERICDKLDSISVSRGGSREGKRHRRE